jgi:hypothetical protein
MKLYFAEQIGRWHKAFAWMPHDTTEGVVWLRFAFRAKFQVNPHLDRNALDQFYMWKKHET